MDIFLQLSIWIIVLPFTAGVINFKGLNNDSRWIFLVVCLAMFPQLMTFFIGRETIVLNIAYNVYTVAECLIFYRLFRSKYLLRMHVMIVDVSVVLFISTSLIIMMLYHFTQFLNYLVCFSNLLYMLWILLLLKEQFESSESLVRAANPFSWYLLGILLYSPCAVTFALYHFIRENSQGALMKIWIIQSIFNIVLYLLFTRGLFIRRQNDHQSIH